MEVDQFIGFKKAGMKAPKRQETNEAGEDNIWLKNLSNYFRYFSVFFSVSSDNTRFSFMLGT